MRPLWSSLGRQGQRNLPFYQIPFALQTGRSQIEKTGNTANELLTQYFGRMSREEEAAESSTVYVQPANTITVSLTLFNSIPITTTKKRFSLRADGVSRTQVASSVLQPFNQELKTKGHFKTTSKRSIGQASVVVHITSEST